MLLPSEHHARPINIMRCAQCPTTLRSFVLVLNLQHRWLGPGEFQVPDALAASFWESDGKGTADS